MTILLWRFTKKRNNTHLTPLQFLQKSGLPQALLLHTNDVAPSGGRPLYAPFIQRIGYMIIDRQQTLDKVCVFHP